MLPVLFATAMLLQQQPQTTPPVMHVVVSPANPTVAAGDSLRLTAEVRDSAGKVIRNASVRWLGGSFEGRVDSLGFVHGGSRGTVVIFAVPSVGGTPGKPTPVQVRVTAAPAARIDVTPANAKLLVGQRAALNGVVRASNGDIRDDVVAWRSSAPNVVRVSGDGFVEALAPGSATITAAVGKATGTAALTVAGGSVSKVEVSADKAAVRTGDVVHLSARAHGASGPIEGVLPTWTVAPGTGQISGDGAFVAEQPGVYTVSATYGTTTGSTSIKVGFRDVKRPTTVLGRVPVSDVGTAEFWPHPNKRNAYLSTIGSKLFALDISNPANPVITDSVIVDARHINDIMTTADGKYGVMTRENASSRRNGIVILSLEDPAHPKVLSEFTETVTGGVHSVFVYTQPKHGTHVFLTDDATGSMRVIDLNDPAKPREVARWQTKRTAGRVLHDIDIRDGLAYLSYWNDNLIILDIGNGMKGGSPTNPQLVSQFAYDLEKLYRDVETEGGPGYIRGTHTAWRHRNYVFVGDEVFTAKPIGVRMPGMGLGKANGALHVIDVTDISNPRKVAYYEPKDGGVHNVWVAGDTLYIGDYQGGLRVVDISGELMGDLLAQGREIAHVHTGDAKGFVPNAAMTWGAFYQDGVVWANDIFSGLWAIRVEPRPSPPRVIP